MLGWLKRLFTPESPAFYVFECGLCHNYKSQQNKPARGRFICDHIDFWDVACNSCITERGFD